MSKPSMAVPGWVVWVIVVSISLIWVANAAARVFVSGYEPNAGIDTLMLAVVGFLLATRKGGDDDEDDSPTNNNSEKGKE
ncbi:hypothetical protein PBI_LAUER_22 [Gordonia phage Lauer]|uniref:Uncharacterized protein n=2 Tax=Ponsvirus TaxID=3044795 RepID=A0AAE7XBZ5_9CAUD|nr:hypothetical protein PP995_gp22 [Gordonia phage Lauer]YP_010663441.1 hypothetical protein PP998_gp24 [Gordonia phage Vine]QGJ92131.1 hypothetical protein PBI_LAUER_22 [Gordonia phage Lauer]QZD97733.1 hypothetical protein SEA_VINE_24 [Gordonia phage Vine]WNN94155.1 membrane protein [Gordonia phage Elinal]